MALPKIVDNALDTLIAPGFSRIGYALRASRFRPLTDYSLQGKTVVITGPTSGIGRAVAGQIAALGADLVLVGRSQDRLQRVSDELASEFPDRRVTTVVADMGDLEAVRQAVRTIETSASSIHALVHNAGALTKARETSPQGHESTIATHVLGPHLMTTMLLPLLRASRGRVITVSSGGMYAATVPDIEHGQSPEMSEKSYDGTRQYAIAKRIQVTLNEMWAEREPEIAFAAMHPGWADTPGVQTSLPTFRLVTKPFLRTAEQGADTICWLIVDDAMKSNSGKFWCDREVRAIHRLDRTRKSDSVVTRNALWKWCDTSVL